MKIKVVDISSWKMTKYNFSKVIHFNAANKINSQINKWFNTTRRDDLSPIITIEEIAHRFNTCLNNFGLNLNMSYSNFCQRLCSATCTMAFREFFQKTQMGFPLKMPLPPKGWSNEIENIWNDYLELFHLNSDFWDFFWSDISVGIWETAFPDFRNYIQTILPLFIKRDIELLVKNELVAQNSNGEFVDIYDADLDINYESDEWQTY